MRLENNFEGGSDTTTITAGNSGGISGTAFTTVSASLATITYSSTTTRQTDSLLAARYAATSNGASALVRFFFTAVDIVYVRAYIKSTTLSGAIWPLRVLSSSSAQNNYFYINSSGNFVIRSHDVQEDISTMSFSNDTWYRLEMKVQSGATTNGAITGRIFSSIESNTIAETLSLPACTTSTGPTDLRNVYYGFTASTNNTNVLYTDDVAATDTDWLGPVDYINILNNTKFFNPQAVYRM